MRQAKTVKTKNIVVDKTAFDDILGVLIASPPIRQDDLKPKRKRYTPDISREAKKTVIERGAFDAAMQMMLKAPPLPKKEVSRILKTRAKLDRVLPQTPSQR